MPSDFFLRSDGPGQVMIPAPLGALGPRSCFVRLSCFVLRASPPLAYPPFPAALPCPPCTVAPACPLHPVPGPRFFLAGPLFLSIHAHAVSRPSPSTWIGTLPRLGPRTPSPAPVLALGVTPACLPGPSPSLGLLNAYFASLALCPVFACPCPCFPAAETSRPRLKSRVRFAAEKSLTGSWFPECPLSNPPLPGFPSMVGRGLRWHGLGSEPWVGE